MIVVLNNLRNTETKKEPQIYDSYRLVAEEGLEPTTSRL